MQMMFLLPFLKRFHIRRQTIILNCIMCIQILQLYVTQYLLQVHKVNSPSVFFVYFL